MTKCVCNNTCFYYVPHDEDTGICLFSFSHPMGDKKLNQLCDLEDYLNYPVWENK